MVEEKEVREIWSWVMVGAIVAMVVSGWRMTR